MQNVLITGLERALGAGLAREFAPRFHVSGLTSNHDIACDWVEVIHTEGNQADALMDYVQSAKPAWIIHCGPTSASSWDTPQVANQQSVVADTEQLVHAALAVGARLTLLSTDAVFQGPRLFHAAHHRVTAHDAYSSAALAVEQVVLAAGFQVVRTHAFGWSPLNGQADFSEQLWQKMSQRESLVLDPQRLATPILVEDLAARILRLEDLQPAGLWHISGAERIDQVRWAYEMAASGGLGRFAWKNASVRGQGRMQEASLDCRAARRNLRMPPPLARESLQRFAEVQTSAADGKRSGVGRRAMAA